jgi:hypothetical protein
VTKLHAKQLSVMDALVHYRNWNAFVVKIILVVKIAWQDHLAGVLRIAGFFLSFTDLPTRRSYSCVNGTCTCKNLGNLCVADYECCNSYKCAPQTSGTNAKRIQFVCSVPDKSQLVYLFFSLCLPVCLGRAM